MATREERIKQRLDADTFGALSERDVSQDVDQEILTESGGNPSSINLDLYRSSDGRLPNWITEPVKQFHISNTQASLNSGDSGGTVATGGIGEGSPFQTAVTTAATELGAAQFEGITSEDQTRIGDQLGAAGTSLLQSGLGTGIDPRFEAFRQSQIESLSTQQQQQQARQSEFFNRRGLGGSSAALNEQNKLGAQFGQQRQNLTSQIGLQGIAQQNQNLSQGSALLGQEFGLLGAGAASRNQAQEGRFNALAAQIETLQIPEQLKIQLLNAQIANL